MIYRALIWNFIKGIFPRNTWGRSSAVLVGDQSYPDPCHLHPGIRGFPEVRLPGDTNIWDFALYFAAGFLPWTAFQTSVMRAAGSIIDNKNYIKKVPFPSEIFPIYVTLSECVNLLIGLVIFFALYVILKGVPTIFIFLLPLAIVLQMMFTFSLAFFLSSGSVYFRIFPRCWGQSL